VLAGEAASPCLGRHGRPSLGLHDLEGDRAHPACHSGDIAGEQRSDRHVVDTGHDAGASNVDAPVVEGGPGTGPGLKRPDLAIDLDGRRPPVDPAIRPRERPDVRRQPVVLG
jgi:hypothetical protein